MTGTGPKTPRGWGLRVFGGMAGPFKSQALLPGGGGEEEPPGWGGVQARTPRENSGLDPYTLGTRKMTRP